MDQDRSLSHPSRRSFIKGAILTAGAAASSARLHASDQKNPPNAAVSNPPEWRNKVDGMAYRRLGRSGMMVSELTLGGSGQLNNPEKVNVHLAAIERGVNYIDSASRYNRGDSEKGWGKMLNDHPGLRDKLFIATKMSSYLQTLQGLTNDWLKGQPSEKQNAIRARAVEMAEARQVAKPGYFIRFFNNQQNEITRGYLLQAIKEESGFLAAWKATLEKSLIQEVETSLSRLGVETIDVLFCPHGARLPEDLKDAILPETFAALKQQGKIRFTSFSSHTDPPRVLRQAADLGYYDCAMVAYNIANQGTMEPAIRYAVEKADMGIIAMKAAAAVHTDKKGILPLPAWRQQKLDTIIPGDMNPPVKGYLWALQNQNIGAVISEIGSREMILENLTIVGKKVDMDFA